MNELGPESVRKPKVRGRTALVLACHLLLFAACGGSKGKAPSEDREAQASGESSALDPKRQAAPLVVWTDLDPASPAAGGVERLVLRHLENRTERPVSLQYVNAEELERRLREAESEELPPDLVLLDSQRLTELARRARLEAWDDAPEVARGQEADIYPLAWASVQADGHVWGIPICGETQLRFARSDSASTGTLDDASFAESSGLVADDLKEFLEGQAAECVAATSGLVGLLKTDPKFGWRTEPDANGRFVARESFRTLALGRPRGAGKPLSAADGFLKTVLSKDAVFILWRHGSQIPVRRMPEEAQFLARIRFRGPWISEWK